MSNIDGVRYIPPTSSIDSYSLASASDLIITFGSTIGVESLYLGKPTISLAKCSATVFRCLRYVESTDELEKYLLNPSSAFMSSWRYYLEDYSIFWLFEGINNRWSHPLELDKEALIEKAYFIFKS